MTQESGDRIIKSLESAIAHAKGDLARGRRTYIDLSAEPVEDDVVLSTEEQNGLPSIHGALTLEADQCIVALCEDGTGVIVARSETIAEHDILLETTAEDNAFDPYWDQGLNVGLYLLKVLAWADGEDGGGITVEERTPLWAAPEVPDVAADPGEMLLKGVWLDARTHKPQGGMILWRYLGGLKWRLSLAYLSKSGTYLDCGGLSGGKMSKMTHFMEIPE